MLRVTKERQESTIRVTKIELAIREALVPFGIEEDDHGALLELEVLEALANVSAKTLGSLRRAQISDSE